MLQAPLVNRDLGILHVAWAKKKKKKHDKPNDTNCTEWLRSKHSIHAQVFWTHTIWILSWVMKTPSNDAANF